MFFTVQEIPSKRKQKGYSKNIETGVKVVDGISVNYYQYSDDRFIREPKSSYRITMQESYREDGKIKKRQWVITTLNYYEIAEAYEDVYKNVFSDDILWYKILSKIDEICIKHLSERTDGLNADELEEFKLNLYDLVGVKLDELFNKIQTQFKETEEFKVHDPHRLLIQEYEDRKYEFLKEYDAYSEEYDICYDFYGNLTNNVYLEKIKNRSKSGYQEQKRINYGSSTVLFTEDEQKMLKQFYRTLGKVFHPDSNIEKDTTEQMKLLNKLREQWNL